jgi:hypothetical protein
MSNRVVAAVAGGVGLAAVITAAALAAVIAAAALTYAPESPAPVARAATSRPARALDPPRVRQAEELIEPSVLIVPTVTIYGQVPRRGVAEFQRPDKRAAKDPIVALP